MTTLKERVWQVLTPPGVRRLLESTLMHLNEYGWVPLGAGGQGVEDDPILRQDALDASRYYWQRDPLYGRGVRLTRNYTFGRGVTWRANDDQVAEVLQSFWDDADNVLVARASGQWELSERIQTDGELFLTQFVNRYSGAVRFGLVEPDEIKTIVTDSENARQATHYKRIWQEKEFDFVAGSYGGGKTKTDYYLDWNNRAGDNSTVGNEKTDVYMHLWKVNSRGVRGLPVHYSGITWVKVYKGFMEDRSTLTLASATFAFKQKIKGGAAAVSRLVSQWGGMIAGRYGGRGTGRERREGAQTIIENEATNLEQLNFDTRSGNAYQDGRMFRQMVAAAMDITEPDLTGDPSVGNLASMTAMNGPQLKGFESWQQYFADFYRDLFGFVIGMAIRYGDLTLRDESGHLRDLTVEVDFPPLVVRDLPSFIGAIASLINAQSVAGVEYIAPRRLAAYILQAFGETDVETALAELELTGPVDTAQSVEDFTTAVEMLREAIANEQAQGTQSNSTPVD